MKNRTKLPNIYIGVVTAVLYLPIVLVIIYSFNESKISSVWGGFSLKWYETLFRDAAMFEALGNSIVLALCASLGAAVIGTLGAYGFTKVQLRTKSAVEYVSMLPIMIPEIILGMVFMTFFALIGLPFGMTTLILAHTAFCVPYVYMLVKARLVGMDKSLAEAARDLGAGEVRVFFDIPLPLLVPAILSGMLLSFAMSLDDVIISIFVTIADIFLRLMDENRLTITDTYLEIDDEPALPGMEFEISNYISNVMNTMKSQEESENFDLLTGLPMRNTGQKMIAQLMQEHNGCLIFMDMDNLKKINDIYGHKAGDRALKALGALLSEHIGNSVGCRFGGDEFLLFVPDAGKNEISELMETLFSRFDSEKKKDFEIRVASISAGLCMCTKGDSFDECSSKADKALYYVKQNGKHNFFFYQQMGNTVFPVSSVAKDLSLVAKVLRNSGNYSGALNLNYREFSKIYEYINQLGERHKYHCFLVMVTMETAPDSMMYIENIEQALEYMEEAIRHKIRRIDVCTRYSALQYLIILFESDESQIPKVMDRIFIQYYKLYDKRDFIPKYEYLPVNEHSEETNPQNTSDHLNQDIHPV